MFQRADTTNMKKADNCEQQHRSNHSKRGYSLILVLGVVSVVTVLVMGLVTSVMNENWYSKYHHFQPNVPDR